MNDGEQLCKADSRLGEGQRGKLVVGESPCPRIEVQDVSGKIRQEACERLERCKTIFRIY